ncbi:uncharacterized protein LOC144623470 isoform X2 [Crassostrea virginica]
MLVFYTTLIRTCVLIYVMDTKVISMEDTFCSPPECCTEYSLDDKNGILCSGCLEVFYGSTCSSACPYPLHGKLCQRTCNCTKEHCNHTTGCQHSEVNAAADNNSSFQNPKILYTSNIKNTSEEGRLYGNSVWNSFDLKHKVMLVSICVMGSVFLTFTSIYVTINRRTGAIVSYSC